MSKEVELRDAKYAVFMDFFPDPYIRGFATLEDARENLEEELEHYKGDHYIVEIVERRDGEGKGNA